MLAPPPGEPKGWWVELEFDRWVAGVEADMRAARVERRHKLAEDGRRAVDRALAAAEAKQAEWRRVYEQAFVRSGSPDFARWAADGGYK